ncbi:MAG: oxidoreductase domain protein [Pedosphaera sp.]|nr:oxidoreductase domain protein [Pedosphaera sp.]
MNPSFNKETSRREFIKTSAIIGGALAAPAILPGKLFAAENSDTLRIGLIGCGNRGTGAAEQALKADKNVVITAMGDVFSDRLEQSLQSLTKAVPGKVKVDAEHRFIGFDAYQKVIDSGVDVVLLATPPGFRPAQLKAAVAAGKHIFTEKPMAVDAPGVRSVLESVAEAKKKNLALVAGFCWRYSYGERAAYQQIHEGGIGDVTTLYGTFNVSMNSRWDKWTRANSKSDMECMMRRWYFYPGLSGDHLVEQAVHTVDKMLWAMKDVPPVKALGFGGRQVRTGAEYGVIFDHFSIVYDFANSAKGFIYCRQQDNCSGGVSDTIYGTKGICEILGGRKLQQIKGEKPWKYKGPHPDMYQVEHNELFASIRSGKPINDGVRMANSTLTAIMGRMAAYTGQSITWDEAMNSQEKLLPDVVDWDHVPPVPQVAMPGRTKFI